MPAHIWLGQRLQLTCQKGLDGLLNRTPTQGEYLDMGGFKRVPCLGPHVAGKDGMNPQARQLLCGLRPRTLDGIDAVRIVHDRLLAGFGVHDAEIARPAKAKVDFRVRILFLAANGEFHSFQKALSIAVTMGGAKALAAGFAGPDL